MRKVADKIMEIVFLVLACVSIVAVVIVCYFMFSRGIPAIRQIGLGEFITGKIWKPTYDYFGILPMIVGSLMVTVGALVIGVPVGIFMAVFMARFCPRIIYKIANPIVNLLAGIPSIIYGFFGMMIVVPFIREHIGGKGYSILSASIILGIMILPTIIRTDENAWKNKFGYFKNCDVCVSGLYGSGIALHTRLYSCKRHSESDITGTVCVGIYI